MQKQRKQKQAIKNFVSVSGAGEKTAKQILSKHNYSVEQALDHYFSNRHHYPASATPQAAAVPADGKKLNQIFDKYAGEDKESDSMFDEKLAAFCEDVGVDPEGYMTLALAWHLKAKTFGEFSRSEFCEGFAAAGADTLAKIKAAVQKLDTTLTTRKDEFRKFYRWVFEFVKEAPDRRTIDKEAAVQMWGVLLPGRFAHADEWLEFAAETKEIKAVSKDLWFQLWEFVSEIKPDFSNFDADGGAWPGAIDSFVEKLQEKKK